MTTKKTKRVKGWVLLDCEDDKTLQEFQNGLGLVYEPMYKVFKTKGDALGEADGESFVVKCEITYTLP